MRIEPPVRRVVQGREMPHLRRGRKHQAVVRRPLVRRVPVVALRGPGRPGPGHPRRHRRQPAQPPGPVPTQQSVRRFHRRSPTLVVCSPSSTANPSPTRKIGPRRKPGKPAAHGKLLHPAGNSLTQWVLSPGIWFGICPPRAHQPKPRTQRRTGRPGVRLRRRNGLARGAAPQPVAAAAGPVPALPAAEERDEDAPEPAGAGLTLRQPMDLLRRRWALPDPPLWPPFSLPRLARARQPARNHTPTSGRKSVFPNRRNQEAPIRVGFAPCSIQAEEGISRRH